MNTLILLENSVSLSLSESWDRTCSVMIDRPLSAAFWKLQEKTGEDLFEELPPLVVNAGRLTNSDN